MIVGGRLERLANRNHLRYHIPESLTGHVDFITPGVGATVQPRKALSDRSLHKRDQPSPELCASVGNPLPPNLNNRTLESCWEGVFPECLNALYGIPTNSTQAADNDIAVFAAAVTYLQSDMDIFFNNLAPQIPQGTLANNMLINGVNFTEVLPSDQTKNLVLEADLDFQILWPHIYPSNVTLFSAAPSKIQIAAGKALLGNDSDGTAEQNLLVLTSLEDVFSAFDSVSHICPSLIPPSAN